ncbi:MAG: class I SAM-dependent methyltransferase [Acidimicrobiales bacterium]
MDSEDWNRRYASAELVWVAEPNRFLVAEVAALSAGSALDLGAGEGRNAVWLAQQGWQVTAVDFAEVGLDKASKLAAAAEVHLSTVCADLTTYCPPPAAFDLVVVLYLHLPAPLRRVIHRRAADAVAAGGVLLVVGHDATNIGDGYGGPQDQDVLYSPDDVRNDLTDSGISIEKAQRVRRTVETPDGQREAIDALVRARRVMGR